MCTVTYIPNVEQNSFILTSNRDEKFYRKTKAPNIYTVNGTKLCFPKDEEAGGSWIAFNENGRICCLLNGGFENHIKQPYQTESRGKALIDLSTSTLPADWFFNERSLRNYQPFTIITIDQENGSVDSLSEFIWDGRTKYYKTLSPDTPHIWSSATLYDKETRERRKQWFNAFIVKNNISKETIYDFHSGTHTNNQENNVVMERATGTQTVSISQISSLQHTTELHYTELLNKHTWVKRLSQNVKNSTI